MNVRPATHAGSWYSDDPNKLNTQLNRYFDKAKLTLGVDDHGVPGARVLIGPHAGYTYSGERLAETFMAWDTSRPIKTVFILGPSHHVAFRGKVLVSGYDAYETPLGDVQVDTEVVKELKRERFVGVMDESVDEEEHSFEMHMPFIKYRLNSTNTAGGGPGGAVGTTTNGMKSINTAEGGINARSVGTAGASQLSGANGTTRSANGTGLRSSSAAYGTTSTTKIVPILILSLDSALSAALSSLLLPYLQDPANHFVISSDFCHWGSRFAYTKYYLDDNLINLSSYKLKLGDLPVYKSIEKLDRQAMLIASTGDYQAWVEYIRETGNTICGQKPIAVVLRMLEMYSELSRSDGEVNQLADSLRNDNGKISNGTSHDYTENPVFNWIGYSQSNQAKKVFDSSVSYASGYVKL